MSYYDDLWDRDEERDPDDGWWLPADDDEARLVALDEDYERTTTPEDEL